MTSSALKKTMILSLFALSSGCGSNGEEEEEELPPVVDCSAAQPVPAFAQVQAFQTVCTNCHSTARTGSARNGAPADINFDQYSSAFVHAEQAAIEVNAGAMPPASSKLSLTEVQKATLFNWAMCGAPQ